MTKKANLVVRNAENKKANIPRALREQVWIQNIGKQFEHKCLVEWCQNQINVFDFHVGHNIPESQGGATNINNLKPICARCNLSMGSQYSIEEWSKIGQILPHKNKRQSAKKEKPKLPVPVTEAPKKPWWLFCC
jgi:5-methylcytosine-specific restriction endonuclease McrA